MRQAILDGIDSAALFLNPLKGLDRIAARRPRYRSLKLRGRRWFFVFDPALIRQILKMPPTYFEKPPLLAQARTIMGNGLVTIEGGEAHREARKTLNPFFANARIADALPSIEKILDEELKVNAEAGVFHLSSAIEKTALRSLCVLLLNSDIDSEMTDSMLQQIRAAVKTMAPFRTKPSSEEIVAQSREFLENVCGSILNEKQHDESTVCPHLLRLEKEEQSASGTAIDHLITFLIAGHDTTSRLIEWTIHLVDQSGRSQEFTQFSRQMIHESFDDTTDAATGFQRYLSESLRLRPPAWVMGRSAGQDIDDELIPEIQTGDGVAIPLWSLHRSASRFENPNEFSPDRWDKPRHSDKQLGFMPFGDGPRFCIGDKYAWREATTILTFLFGKYNVKLLPGRKPIQPRPEFSLTLSRPLRGTIN